VISTQIYWQLAYQIDPAASSRASASHRSELGAALR
jgi:hypothetical protein